MSKVTLILAAGAMVAGFATQTLAESKQNHGEIHHEDIFNAIDTDDSGGLSLDELTAAHESMDKDGDGEVSPVEFSTAPQKE